MHCLLQTRYSAHVVPQSCTIPHIGKAVSLYHTGYHYGTPKNQVVRNIGYTLFCVVAPLFKSHPISFWLCFGLWLQVSILGIRPCSECLPRSFVGCAPMFVYHPCVFVVPFLCVWYWCIRVQNVPCMCLKNRKILCLYAISVCLTADEQKATSNELGRLINLSVVSTN